MSRTWRSTRWCWGRPILRCLERLTVVFSRVFQAAGRRIASDVATTIGLGFPWAAAELLAREASRLPLIGRFDFVQDTDGCWKLLELDADTPSGVREGAVCDQLVAELCLRRRGWLGRARSRGAAVEAIQGVLEPRQLDASPGVLGIVTTASELEDLSQMAFTADLLRPHVWQSKAGRSCWGMRPISA